MSLETIWPIKKVRYKPSDLNRLEECLAFSFVINMKRDTQSGLWKHFGPLKKVRSKPSDLNTLDRLVLYVPDLRFVLL